MSDAPFLRRIRLGEDSILELKSVRVSGSRVRAPDRNDLADELAALANSRGGTVVLGVDDKTRRIQDIAPDALDVLEGWIREICNDSVAPALDADILKVELENEGGHLVPVLRFDVARSLWEGVSIMSGSRPRGNFAAASPVSSTGPRAIALRSCAPRRSRWTATARCWSPARSTTPTWRLRTSWSMDTSNRTRRPWTDCWPHSV